MLNLSFTSQKEELDKWFKNMDNNIGIVCGMASGVDPFDLDTDIFADELYGDT